MKYPLSLCGTGFYQSLSWIHNPDRNQSYQLHQNRLNRLFQLFILTTVVLFQTPVFGQNTLDLFRAEYAGSPGNDYKTGPGSSNLDEFAAELTIPVRLSAKAALLTGFLYEHVQVSPYPDQPELSVSTLNLKLGLSQTYSSHWSATYLLLPKFSSDLKQYERADFQFGVAALAKYTRSKNLQYKFGAMYNSDLFGPFVTPLFGLYYQHNKWETNILIPRLVDLNYRLLPTLRFGVRFNGSIKSFNLNVPYHENAQYLAVSNNELLAYLGWNKGRIHLIGSFGYSLGRNYRTYNRDEKIDLAISLIKIGDERTPTNVDFKDGPVFKLSALYRLELEN